MRLWIYLIVFSLFTAIVSKTYALEHIAQKGDNISKILRHYGVEPKWGSGNNVDQVLDANDEMLRQFPGSIEVGQVIVIPDDVIKSNSSANTTTVSKVDSATIKAKIGKLSISELTTIEKSQIQVEEEKIELTLAALHSQLESEIDTSLDTHKEDKKGNKTVQISQPNSNDETTNTTTPSATEMDTAIAKFIQAEEKKKIAESTNGPTIDIQIEPLTFADLTKIDNSPIQKTNYSQNSEIKANLTTFEPSDYAVSSKIAVSPMVSRMRIKKNHGGKSIELKEEDGSGIGIGFEIELQKKFKAMINYDYREIKFGKLKNQPFKQQGNTMQSFDLKLGYKPHRLMTVMATSSMVENFVLFEINNALYLQTNWTPAVGIELDVSDTYRQDRARWRFAIGAQHLPRQQIDDRIKKWGTRAYANANFTTKMYEHSFFRINLGFDHLDQRINRGQQFSNQTSAGISFGSEL